MPKKIDLGPTLFALREKNNKTQKEVAENLKIAVDTYKAYELSRAVPPLNVLLLLVEFYGFDSLDTLLNLQKTGQKGIQQAYNNADKKTKDIVNYILNAGVK